LAQVVKTLTRLKRQTQPISSSSLQKRMQPKTTQSNAPPKSDNLKQPEPQVLMEVQEQQGDKSKLQIQDESRASKRNPIWPL
jgi:translation initiation factor 2 beta subunit (eIF-2beta)/eIF-5